MNSASKTVSQEGQAALKEGLKKESVTEGASSGHALLGLQREAGNRAVTNLLAGSSGKPLDRRTREEMESKFGQDFGDVQIHSGEATAKAALSAGARAITHGRDIVFGPGFYAPATADGKKLIAHELAHVVQQNRPAGPSASSAAAESEARQAGASAVAGQSASVHTSASVGPQADPMTDEEKKRKAKPARQESLEEMEARLFNPMNPYARQNLAKTIEAIGGRSYEADKVSYEFLMAEYQKLKTNMVGQKPPPYSGPSIGPSNEPPDRRRRYITVRGADFTGLDPTVKETREVWATAEEAEQMEIDANAQFGARAATAALGGIAGMGAARSANATMGQGIVHGEMQHGAPLRPPPEHEASVGARETPAPPLPRPAAPVTPAPRVSIPKGSTGTTQIVPPPSAPAQPQPQAQPQPSPAPHAASPAPAQAPPTSGAAPPVAQPAAAAAAPAGAKPAAAQPLFWRKAELSAVSKIASENQSQAVDLNTVGKSNFAGLDVVSAGEMASVKAYDGPTATTRYINDLQTISGGRGGVQQGSKVTKAVNDLGKLQTQMAAKGTTLPLPQGYQKDPAQFIEQNTVLRIPDDHVTKVRDEIVRDLTDPANPYGYQNYGLPGPVTPEQARAFAETRVKGLGTTMQQLVK
jgi:hypothetical protein